MTRKVDKDAFGHEMFDYLKDGSGYEIVERDDGFIDHSGGPKAYFSDYKDWSMNERKAMRYVKGRVLDIGCGAGRHALYLQEKGFDVTGIDNSPLALEVARRRGVKKTKLMSVTQVSRKLGTFDTIIMMGQNLALLGNPKRAGWLLGRFHAMTSEDARIIGQNLNPYKTTNLDHFAYHKLNRKRGRMAGQVRIRVRYRRYVGEWFDYLLLSKDELKRFLKGMGWKIHRFFESKQGQYVAVIEKE